MLTKRPCNPAQFKNQGKAADLAGEVIDRHSDRSATSEERERRKRRLLKDPKEFRDMPRSAEDKTLTTLSDAADVGRLAAAMLAVEIVRHRSRSLGPSETGAVVSGTGAQRRPD
jgi:hypothetical protein